MFWSFRIMVGWGSLLAPPLPRGARRVFDQRWPQAIVFSMPAP
jgi:hypothetical protein